MSYESFIDSKSASSKASGLDPDSLAQHLFPFQSDLVRWALRRGRAAIFADTGLGKTFMQIEWARHVSRHGRVLILTPLAVAQQTVAALSPFAGIASEGVVSVELGRRFVGAELKESYYKQAVANLRAAAPDAAKQKILAFA